MAFVIYILSVLVLFFLAGAVPVHGVPPTEIFRSPVFIALMGTVCGGCVVAIGMRRRWQRPGFVLCHLGVVLVCVGALVGYGWGKQSGFRTPVSAEHATDALPRADGTSIPLGFQLAVVAAKADYYPPKAYNMFAPPEYDFVREVAILPDDTLDLPPELQPAPDALRDEKGKWSSHTVLSNGNMLQIVPPTAKYYEATLRFMHDDAASDTRVTKVNHPVTYRGWRFYLMDYSTDPYLTVSLSARHDPGRLWVIVGIWVLIVGTAWLCWIPRRQAA